MQSLGHGEQPWLTDRLATSGADTICPILEASQCSHDHRKLGGRMARLNILDGRGGLSLGDFLEIGDLGIAGCRLQRTGIVSQKSSAQCRFTLLQLREQLLVERVSERVHGNASQGDARLLRGRMPRTLISVNSAVVR